MQIRTFSFLIFLLISISIHAQTATSNINNNKKQISINTSKERVWWNLLHYTIAITPDLNKKFISGTNKVTFIALQPGNIIQIDLQDPMRITSITWKNL